MSAALTVLITNRRLNGRTGTELYVRDLAVQLLARGHRPIVYSPVLGPIADELLERTVPVVDALDNIGVAPDVIHGHHHPETVQALSHFPRAPGLFVCHDWSAWHDVPPRLPRLYRYCAVDQTCYDKLVAVHGVPAADAEVHYNAVDLRRFQARPPLPARPQRAAVFTNYGYDLAPLRAACAAHGIALDVLGGAGGKTLATPETALGGYDLVFAKARAALEAMAVGCAVIVCDFRGVAGLVTSANFDQLRPLNFGARSLRHRHETARISAEIEAYDAADAARVSARVRAEAGLEDSVDGWIERYRDVIARHAAAAPDPDAEGRALAAYLRDWGYERRREWERERIFRLLPAPLVRAAQRWLLRR